MSSTTLPLILGYLSVHIDEYLYLQKFKLPFIPLSITQVQGRKISYSILFSLELLNIALCCHCDNYWKYILLNLGYKLWRY